MSYTKKQRRIKALRNFVMSKEFWTAVTLGFLASSILTKTVYDTTHKTSVRPTSFGEVKQAEAMTIPFCYDPLQCIRDVGEEMGESNEHIKTMIKISRCESNLNPMALNKNKNGTFDVGLMQINDVHNKRISRKDRMDYEKNIRFAWTLHQEQKHSFNAWSCYKNVK